MPNQDELLDILKLFKEDFLKGLSEFDLLKKLQAEPFGVFEELNMHDSLIMFRCHFILFNSLYRLQDIWLKSGEGRLDVFTTNIKLETLYDHQPTDKKVEQSDSLRQYYLDWSNFDDTSSDDVDALLNDFWEAYVSGRFNRPSICDINTARDILGFDASEVIKKSELKRRYFTLQGLNHPDKGGDAARSQSISWAYGCLRKLKET